MRGPSLLDITLLVAFLLLLRLFLAYQDVGWIGMGPYSPHHLTCHPYKGEKIVKCQTLIDAVSYATSTEGWVMIAAQQNPPRIIIGIANESYRALVPKEILGIPVEVKVTGAPHFLGSRVGDTCQRVASSGLRLRSP
jgi:hypothetical protein